MCVRSCVQPQTSDGKKLSEWQEKKKRKKEDEVDKNSAVAYT